MSKPSDLFLGVTDLFSVILPGACTAFVGLKLEQRSGADVFSVLRLGSTNEGYVVFFAVGYILGHVIDMTGSIVLDRVYDLTYSHRMKSPSVRFWDWLKATPRRVKDELRRTAGKPATESLIKEPVELFDPLLKEAGRLAADSMPAGDRVYQWSRSWVCLRSPAAFVEIERLQANSKFFRGLVTVFVITMILSLTVRPAFKHNIESAILCLLLATTSFLRFCDLRWKAVHQTYRFFIALRSNPDVVPEASGDDGQ